MSTRKNRGKKYMIETVCPLCGGNILPIRDWYACSSSMCSYVPAKSEEPEVEETPVEEEDEVILEEEEAPEEVVEEEESDDDGDLEAYLEALPVKELKKLCEEADLSKKGKKADLVARLLE